MDVSRRRIQQATQLIESYRRLQQHISTFSGIPLLAFDDQAAAQLKALHDSRVRIGTMDRRIAAIALANGATVLTRNTSDFSRVPNLRVEDWSV
jgi:tRNA(fMet)-specific endonuclease VapC